MACNHHPSAYKLIQDTHTHTHTHDLRHALTGMPTYIHAHITQCRWFGPRIFGSILGQKCHRCRSSNRGRRGSRAGEEKRAKIYRHLEGKWIHFLVSGWDEHRPDSKRWRQSNADFYNCIIFKVIINYRKWFHNNMLSNYWLIFNELRDIKVW